jgi:uncharacterized protein YerC
MVWMLLITEGLFIFLTTICSGNELRTVPNTHQAGGILKDAPVFAECLNQVPMAIATIASVDFALRSQS